MLIGILNPATFPTARIATPLPCPGATNGQAVASVRSVIVAFRPLYHTRSQRMIRPPGRRLSGHFSSSQASDKETGRIRAVTIESVMTLVRPRLFEIACPDRDWRSSSLIRPSLIWPACATDQRRNRAAMTRRADGDGVSGNQVLLQCASVSERPGAANRALAHARVTVSCTPLPSDPVD